MPNMIKIRDFSKGLYLSTPEDEAPPGTLVRGRGIHPISLRSARSAFGSALLHSPMFAEDTGDYTENDPAGRIVKTSSTKITVTDLDNDEEAWEVIDRGVAYYDGDFEFKVGTKITDKGNYGYMYCWMLANSIGTQDQLNPMLTVNHFTTAGGNAELHCGFRTAGGSDSDKMTITEGTQYYLTIKRDESVGTYGTLYCYVYSDSDRTTLLDTLSIALINEKYDFRYLYYMNSTAHLSGGDAVSGVIQNMKSIPKTHSIFRSIDAWYYGALTSFYAGSISIKTGLGGARLAAISMDPTAGVIERLFVAGGEDLFKIDVSTSIVNSSYIWTASGSGTDEYYLTDAEGNNPGLDDPNTLLVDNEAATEGTVGSLTAGEWVYDNNDTLGYDTIYIRFSDGTDPDSKDDDYIKALYVQEWGITLPDGTTDAADGGAGGNLDDGALYKYRFTYYNSKTGVRSNPTPEADGTDHDVYTKLLLHCDGADTHTTFTDSSASNHTVTANGNAQGDTDQKKFGTASLLCDGTGDYLSIPDSADWNMAGGKVTIDFWFRPSSVAANQRFFSQESDADNYVVLKWSQASEVLTFNVKVGGPGEVVYLEADWVPVVGTWYHIALIRGWAGNTNNWALTIDGTAVETKVDTSDWPDLTGEFIIGEWAGFFLAGWIDEFRVSKGIARWTENFTPVGPYGIPAVDLDPGSTSVDLTGIPESSDSQVSHIELWRTQGDSTLYFFLTRLTNGTIIYTDNISDNDLSAIEVPTDNEKPFPWFDDCYGSHNASMFWITRTQAGKRGRLYFSPIGRAEAVEGWIEVTSDADTCQKIFGWRGYLSVITQSGIFQILGTNPYQAKKVAGAPGTNSPHTAVVTPIGLVYEADDGVRVFDGSLSRLLNFDAIGKVFRGISAGDLTSFIGVVATYARGEYIISDTTQTLMLNLEKLTWRDRGVGCNALAYAEEDDIIAASISNTILDFEKEGTTKDNAANITFTIEPAHVRLSEDKEVIVQNVHVDANVNSETLAVSLIADGSIVSLGNLTAGASRQVTTFPAGTLARVAGVKVTGSIDDVVEIFGIDIEV